MPQEEVTLLSYQELLDILQDQESHLLLWNGFNTWLWVKTTYKDIFKKMIEDHWSVYADARDIISECGDDIESFIGRLTQDINGNDFLKKYITNKIKYDFMKATHEIVKNGVRNVYKKKNEWVYILLRNFKNYFTLNFDSFLYLLLLKYKWSDKDLSIGFQPTFNFIEEDINETFNNTIYTEIKEARNNWSIAIQFGSDTVTTPTKKLAKTHFKKEVMTYAKDRKDWEERDIKLVVDHLWTEEKNKKVIEVIDDWMKPLKIFNDEAYATEYHYDVENETQNLFFLHWAFHIFQEGETIKKITQTDDEALYDRLEEILNNWKKDILCVFQAEQKLEEINKSPYLRKALDKLGALSGNIVMIWSSLWDNDQHIFDQINQSSIENIYIASSPKKYRDTFKEAKKKFSNKNIFLFDRDTITYEIPNKI